MTDREFHEIQLSGKQLAFLFISLLALAVVTFLLGVAVGKGVRGDMSEAPMSASADTETVVPEEPAAQPAPARVDPRRLARPEPAGRHLA